MRKIFILLLLFSLYRVAAAQNTYIDSMRQVLANHPQQDTFRVNRLIIFLGGSDMPLDERERLAKELLTISKKNNYVHGEGLSYFFLGLVNKLKGNEEQGELLLHRADSIAKKTGDLILQAKLLRHSALKLYYTNPKKSLEYLLQAEALAISSGDKREIFTYQYKIGDIYYTTLSDYARAMEYYLKALHTAEETAHPGNLIIAFTDIGSIYSIIGDHDNALLYYQKAMEANKNYRDKALESTIIGNLGESYRLSGRYPEAIAAYNRSISLLNNLDLSIYVHESNLADVYTRMDSLDKAFSYAFHSLAQASERNDISAIAWIDGILSRAYLKKNRADSALYYGIKGLAVAKEMGTIEYIRDNAEALSNAYAFKKDFQKAYDYHLQYINYRDSMINGEVRNRTAVQQYTFNLDKKEAQIKGLNQQQKNQRNLLWGAVALLGLILATAVVLWRNNRQKQKANQLLELSHKNMEQLGEVGRKVTSSLSVEKIISTAYQNVNALMDASIFGIGIYNDDAHTLDFPATYEKGEPLPFYTNDINDKNRFASICFTENKEIIMGHLDQEYKQYVQEVVTPFAGEQAVSMIYLPLVAKDQKLGVLTVQSFQKDAYTENHLFMLRNIAVYAAIAIENAEAYEELNKTFVSLRETQKQLIQSEKMASLGELTAGIAHEIQNPLNFVNNFSDLNTELIEELNVERLKPIAQRDEQSENEILNSIKENEQKINHHGKRADAIVKGMLQHSRKSTGQKEPTDINALADEYLRLSYHGLRAKDKSFNATMKTDFDPLVGKVNVIPQDIGRVLLNLFNNAFYAVAEKRKSQSENYEPAVLVSTKKMEDHIIIRIKDNGIGIPRDLTEKIFQPFFTTKPTGKGTGLGLSLSYDIIKAHNGKLNVESKEGEGTEFIITLPV